MRRLIVRIDKSGNNASYADCQQDDKSPCYGNSAISTSADRHGGFFD